MLNKNDLIEEILVELQRARMEPLAPPPAGEFKNLPLPPVLPLGDGRQMTVTNELLRSVSSYCEIMLNDDPALKSRFKALELYQLVARSFGEVLQSVDLDHKSIDLRKNLKNDLDTNLNEMINRHRQAVQLTLGCHLFRGDAAYPIEIGPVVFETREQWRSRAEIEGKLTAHTARRLKATWDGQTLRKRKTTFDSLDERAMLDTIGECPVVCTVSTDGLSSKMLKEKGLLAARLAMTAISLIWHKPSQGLSRMSLRYDSHMFHRHYVFFGDKGYAGSSSGISQMPSGHWTDDEMISSLNSYQSLFDQVGEALNNYVQPAKIAARPTAMNALFLSLWWFYDACRESSDQMAVTKFAASMDSLSAGGKAKGIVKFIEVRLGVGADKPIMKDGRTVKEVVAQFYNSGRSRMIHGSSDSFAHDWSDIRADAEAIGRHCLTEAIDWLAENPETDNIKALSVT